MDSCPLDLDSDKNAFWFFEFPEDATVGLLMQLLSQVRAHLCSDWHPLSVSELVGEGAADFEK